MTVLYGVCWFVGRCEHVNKVKKERLTNRENNLRRFPLEALLLFAITDKVDLLGAVKCAKQ